MSSDRTCSIREQYRTRRFRQCIEAAAARATSSKKDPFSDHDELLIEGLSMLQTKMCRRVFTVDLSQFNEIVRSSYKSYLKFDRLVTKYISLSMFQYYCTILLWRRIWHVATRRGHKVTDYMKLSDALAFEMPIPIDIDMYLKGIGDITDSLNREFYLNFPRDFSELKIANVSGTFGQIDENNHFFYECWPAPFVAYWNMVADFTKSCLDDKLGPADWNLPKGLRPEGENFGLPTLNLLGYNRAVKLTPFQRTTMEVAGIGVYCADAPSDQNVSNVENIPINPCILQFVGKILWNSKCKAFVNTWNEELFGSLAQVPYITRTEDDTEVERLKPISAKNGYTNSFCQQNEYVASAATTFRYRIKRRTQGEERDMVCYMPSANSSIPEEWFKNANTLFNYGTVGGLWNHAEYKLPEMSGSALANNLSTKLKEKFN